MALGTLLHDWHLHDSRMTMPVSKDYGMHIDRITLSLNHEMIINYIMQLQL